MGTLTNPWQGKLRQRSPAGSLYPYYTPMGSATLPQPLPFPRAQEMRPAMLRAGSGDAWMGGAHGGVGFCGQNCLV